MTQLTKLIHKAVEELSRLKKENRQILSELELLRVSQRRVQGFERENQALKKDHDRIRTRIERMSKNIDKLIEEESSAVAAVAGLVEGAPHEKSLQ